MRGPSSVQRGLGTVAIIVLPIVVLFLGQRVEVSSSLIDFVLLFLLAVVGVELGLTLRRWGNLYISHVVGDLAIALAGGVLSWGVMQLAVRRGGGPVDPAMMAVAMAYVIALWGRAR